MKICSKCTLYEIADDANYCSFCGTMLVEAEIKCVKCNKKVFKKDKYCRHCGSFLSVKNIEVVEIDYPLMLTPKRSPL